jgi:poly(3-hydroxybutyrate) depolymerase
MKSIIRCFLILLLSSSGAYASEKIVKDTLVSQGKKRTYYAVIPESIKPSAPAPLVVLLHGSGRNGLSLIDKWKDLAQQDGVIIVGPDSMDAARWQAPQDGPDFLHDLVEAVKAKYPINPRRVYLFGHSGGATFALYMALYESRYFAATAIHAGAMAAQAYPLIDYAQRKIPIAIYVGTRDPFFPLSDVRATRNELNKKGFTVELTELPNHDHNYYDIAPKLNPSVWAFLKKHELAEDPQYERYDFKK